MSDDDAEEVPSEKTTDPVRRLREKADEMRLFAEIAAVFEGTRKFGAEIKPGLDADVARLVQRGMGKLDKMRPADGGAVLPVEAADEAAAVLNAYDDAGLSTSDYHIYRRPGEVMIVRWLADDEVAAFYGRLQAHFDAALAGYRDEQKQDAWKQDEATEKYVELLDKLEVNLAQRYARDAVQVGGRFAISTQTADEVNIVFLTEHVMGVEPAEIVGRASAPTDTGQPPESELAWFYKLFLLRGARDGIEQACFFTYLQKTDDGFDF